MMAGTDTIDRIIDDELRSRLGAAVGAVVAQANGTDAADFPFGQAVDRWSRGDGFRDHPFTGPDQHNLDGDTVLRGEPFPMTVMGGPAEPGDHAGDQCDVMLDGRRVVVVGSVRRGQLDVTVSSPDAPLPSGDMMRSAVLTLRAARDVLASDDAKPDGAARAKARRRVTATVRRALVKRARTA